MYPQATGTRPTIWGWCLRPEPLSPGAELGFQDLAVSPAQDGVEGGRTGRRPRQAQGLGQLRSIVAAPFGNRAVTAGTAEHRTPRKRKDRRQRRALPARVPKIRNLGSDLDQWTQAW